MSALLSRIPIRASVLAMAVLAAACGKAPPQQPPAPPPEVGVVTVKAEAVPLTRDLVGRLSATRTADVRARVAGVLLKRVYTEGTDVKEGQPLFQIDPAPLQAALNAQLANLAAAQATATNNHVAAERARAVASKGLMSKTDWDNAEAAERTSAAAVKQAQANVDSAKINLGYASVTAPISGRAGQQQVTEGALVGQGEATLLTSIWQVDPIYVNFSEAVGELDQLQRAQASGEVSLEGQNKAKVELVLADGTPFGEPGTLDFADTTVDAATGAVSLRGIVPNSGHKLLPGTYVNVRVTFGELKHAYLINQAAVQRDAGSAYVFVVGSDGKVAQKKINTDTLRGDSWLVTGGVADGDQVVVSGLQTVQGLVRAAAQGKEKKEAVAKAVPWQPGQHNGQANAGAQPGKSVDAKPPSDKPAADKPASDNH